MFQGLRTVVYHVPDLAAATTWYTRILGMEPYFAEPFYVGFNIGGYELGLDPDLSSGGPGAGGVIACWGVADADQVLARLLELGAGAHQPVHADARSRSFDRKCFNDARRNDRNRPLSGSASRR